MGEAKITDCVSDHESEWFSGPIGFVLTEAHPFHNVIELPGKLGIFPVEIQLDAIEKTISH